jgi:hypothetical protein
MLPEKFQPHGLRAHPRRGLEFGPKTVKMPRSRALPNCVDPAALAFSATFLFAIAGKWLNTRSTSLSTGRS